MDGKLERIAMQDVLFDLTEARTLAQYRKDRPWLEETTLRHWLSKRAENGLDSCVKRVGLRLLVHPESLDRWIAERATA